mmetsp:Transcript_28918/g.76416  ORF Transcript_28918/g.76416 Transcript_28918/m.76416 type:complete len:217 (+) Transcript_28918:72-722(+)
MADYGSMSRRYTPWQASLVWTQIVNSEEHTFRGPSLQRSASATQEPFRRTSPSVTEKVGSSPLQGMSRSADGFFDASSASSWSQGTKPLELGDTVRIGGVNRRKELNGTHAVVKGTPDAQGRVCVQLSPLAASGQQKVMRIHAKCLEPEPKDFRPPVKHMGDSSRLGFAGFGVANASRPRPGDTLQRSRSVVHKGYKRKMNGQFFADVKSNGLEDW